MDREQAVRRFGDGHPDVAGLVETAVWDEGQRCGEIEAPPEAVVDQAGISRGPAQELVSVPRKNGLHEGARRPPGPQIQGEAHLDAEGSVRVQPPRPVRRFLGEQEAGVRHER